MAAPATWYQQKRLRLIASVSIAAAIMMSVLGRTFVAPYLDERGVSFWIWWGIVLCLVVLALMMAFLELADLRRQLSAEKKELLKKHFDTGFLTELEEKLGKGKTKAENGKQKEAGGEESKR